MTTSLCVRTRTDTGSSTANWPYRCNIPLLPRTNECTIIVFINNLRMTMLHKTIRTNFWDSDRFFKILWFYINSVWNIKGLTGPNSLPLSLRSPRKLKSNEVLQSSLWPLFYFWLWLYIVFLRTFPIMTSSLLICPWDGNTLSLSQYG